VRSPARHFDRRPLLGGGVAVVALAPIGAAKAAQVAVLYLLLQQIEGNTLVPLATNRASARCTSWP